MKGSGKRRICVICESIFDIPQLKHGRDRRSKRITCGQSCHLKLIKRRAKPWTKGEMDIIEEISASMPPKRLYQTYCRMAADRGYPKRTEAAFRCKLEHMGIPLMPELDFYKFPQLAELFKTTRHIAYSLRKHGLKAEKESDHANQPWFVSRAELKRLARKKPGVFRDFDPEGLFVVLEDRALVDLILAQPKVHKAHRYNPTPCRCVETGQELLGFRDAGRFAFVDPSAIYNSCKYGHRAGGYHWVALR